MESVLLLIPQIGLNAGGAQAAAAIDVHAVPHNAGNAGMVGSGNEVKASTDDDSDTLRLTATVRRPPWDQDSGTERCGCVWRQLPAGLRGDGVDQSPTTTSTVLIRPCPACGGFRQPLPTAAEWTSLLRVNLAAQPPHAVVIFGANMDDCFAERQIHGTLQQMAATETTVELRLSCSVKVAAAAEIWSMECRHLQEEVQDHGIGGQPPLLLSGLNEHIGLVFIPSLAAAEVVMMRFRDFRWTTEAGRLLPSNHFPLRLSVVVGRG